MSIIGDNIRALRELHGLTQQELADIANVTRETVNKWENGGIGNVRTTNVDMLRRHFNLSVDDLRSESCGLAAKLSGQHKNIQDSFSIPLLDTVWGGEGQAIEFDSSHTVEVPQAVANNHPAAFAMLLSPSRQSSFLHAVHAIVDPATEHCPESLLAVQISTEPPTVCHVVRGRNKAILSYEGLSECDDRVVDVNDLNVLGLVVWYQCAHELR